MSYNIDTCEYLGEGRLTITGENLVFLKSGIEERAEVNFIDELDPEAKLQIIERPWWYGEGSGNNFDSLKAALSYTRGTAELLLCWEGGDSYGGLRVVNGVVTAHKIVHALGEQE